MYRKVFVANDTADLTIQLPEEYLNKEIEIIAFQLRDIEMERQKKLEAARQMFRENAVDLTNFKFNREEANER